MTDETLELRLGVREAEALIEVYIWLTGADGRVLYVGEDRSKFRQLEGTKINIIFR